MIAEVGGVLITAVIDLRIPLIIGSLISLGLAYQWSCHRLTRPGDGRLGWVKSAGGQGGGRCEGTGCVEEEENREMYKVRIEIICNENGVLKQIKQAVCDSGRRCRLIGGTQMRYLVKHVWHVSVRFAVDLQLAALKLQMCAKLSRRPTNVEEAISQFWCFH